MMITTLIILIHIELDGGDSLMLLLIGFDHSIVLIKASDIYIRHGFSVIVVVDSYFAYVGSF